MDNSLDRFGKDSKWLKENGFQMVPRRFKRYQCCGLMWDVVKQSEADYDDRTVFKKFDLFEIRLQQDAYNEDNWIGWSVFDGLFNNFINHKAFMAKNCESAEDAFKEVILKVKGFAIVVPEKQSLLQNCEIED